MTDCALILSYLKSRPGQWVNVIQIMADLKPNARNWAVRSRISDINRRRVSKEFLRALTGYYIKGRIGANGCEDYRLIKVEPVCREGQYQLFSEAI